MADVEFNPDAKDGDGDGMVQDGTPFERPVGEMPEGFNPDAKDGDGDGMVQDGTEFERPADEPAQEVIKAGATKVVTDKKLEDDEVEGIAPVANGVIGTGTVKKTKPAPKKAAAPKVSSVAIFSDRNLVWQGLGKIVKGYNFVPKEDSAKWLTLEGVREASPEEIKANLG
jgi:hypothetical protein